MKPYYEDKWVTQYCSDALAILRQLESDSVDLLCTDPPYGIGFMGKDWDKALPDKEIWAECLRVLKDGAFAFVMSIPRADCLSRMIISLEDAGFNVGFTPIYWTYASGFPKAQNIGKAVDKRLGKLGIQGKGFKVAGDDGRKAEFKQTLALRSDYGYNHKHISPQAKVLDGSYGGFQPKPAVEVIIVAMKPLSEKTFVDQALKNGKGITWLDDCRIPYESEGDIDKRCGKGIDYTTERTNFSDAVGQVKRAIVGGTPSGRFPANLLVSDDVLNDGKMRKVGQLKNTFQSGVGYGFNGQSNLSYNGGSGSFSRYFDLDKWFKTFPFLIAPKASKREKGKDNNHPTVKPLKLMSYLITLGSRRGDTILDPFSGSGTTLLASKLLNRNCIGIEIEEKYCEIAALRCSQDVMELDI